MRPPTRRRSRRASSAPALPLAQRHHCDMPQSLRQPLIPDAYAVVVIVAVLALDFLVPLPLLPASGWASPLTGLGIALALGGLGLEIAAARELTAAGTTTKPNATPLVLVTS